MGEITGNQFVTFRVDDEDQDTSWKLYLYSPPALQAMLFTDWKQGYLVTNGERDGLGYDTPWSHFKSLQKWHRNDSGFENWGAVWRWIDTDPDYRCRDASATEQYVEQGTTFICLAQ